MPRKALQTEFRLASAGTMAYIDLLAGDLIDYHKLPRYSIESDPVGLEYQLPHLPDEWMFDDRDVFIRDSRVVLGGAYRGLYALKAANLYMEWELGGKSSFRLSVSRIDRTSRQVRFLTSIDNLRYGFLELENLAPFSRPFDLTRTMVAPASPTDRKALAELCRPIREVIFALAQRAADVDLDAILHGVATARERMDQHVTEAYERRAAAAGGGAAGIAPPVAAIADAGAVPRPFTFFLQNPSAEPSNLQEVANKAFSVYVMETGLSVADAESAIRGYAVRHRDEVVAADFADKLGNCVVEVGGGSRMKLLGFLEQGVLTLNEARNAVLGIPRQPLPAPPVGMGAAGGAGGVTSNTRAMSGLSLTESVSGVRGAMTTALMNTADISSLKERMLEALRVAKWRFDRAITEKDVRAVGDMFLVIDDVLLAIQPTVRASVGSFDAIEEAHLVASANFASWIDEIVSHPDEKFREQCIAKLVWRGEGPILRYWITPNIAQKLLLALNQEKSELEEFIVESEWTPKEPINIAALLISRYLSTPGDENVVFLKRAISSYPTDNLLRFLLEGGVPVTVDLYKYALETGHYMAATLVGIKLSGPERMRVDEEMYKSITNNINWSYKEVAEQLLTRLNKLFNASEEDESAPYVGSLKVKLSQLVTQLQADLAGGRWRLYSIDELGSLQAIAFNKEPDEGKAELLAIIGANNDLVKHVVNARAQVLLTRLDDVFKAAEFFSFSGVEDKILKPLKARLLTASSLEPFPELVFNPRDRGVYNKLSLVR